MNAANILDSLEYLDSRVISDALYTKATENKRRKKLWSLAAAACLFITVTGMLLFPHLPTRGNFLNNAPLDGMADMVIGEDKTNGATAPEGFGADDVNGTFIYASIMLKINEITDYGFVATVERDFEGADFYKGHILKVTVDEGIPKDAIELKVGDIVYVGFSFDNVNSITAKKISKSDWSE